MAEENGKKKTEAEEEGEEMWGKVVEMTQTAFREGKLAEEAAWQTVVMIPKGKGEFRGIGLVEVTWKVLAVILHHRLTTGLPAAGLRLAGLLSHIAGRRRIPLTPPKRPTREDTLFRDLQRAVPKPHSREQHNFPGLVGDPRVPVPFPG